MKQVNELELVSLIKSESTVMVGGFVGTGVPEEILIKIEENYIDNQYPKNLTLVFCAGQGDGKDRGLNHLAHEGLVKKAIGGHFGLSPKLGDLINKNMMEGYNLPQGILSHLIRASVSKTPFIISKIGLNTFVDPRLGGGALNKISEDKLVQLTTENDEEYLKYFSFKPDTTILRGTYADKKGNISFEKEALRLDSISMAQAARNNGGIIIVQVEKIVDKVFDPQKVVIPHILVDYVYVVQDLKNHMQTFNTDFSSEFITSSLQENNQVVAKMSERKIIARRAALELEKSDCVLNYGIGIPEMIANVLNEEKQENGFVPTIEPGAIGGTPQGGLDFGVSRFPDMIIDQSYQFDFYDGSGIDCAFLGLAQADLHGNLNVSKFGPKIAGAGGFINISQSAKKIVFCGTFMAGVKCSVANNNLIIEKEGHTKKFINEVEQITFSTKTVVEKNLKVVYVTERAVFDVNKETLKLRLIEIAPGIDLEKDIIAHMEFKPEIAQNLRLMKKEIFNSGKMNLIIE